VRKNNSLEMEVSANAIISTVNGKVLVKLECSSLGTVLCSVEQHGESWGVNIQKVERLEVLRSFGSSGIKTFGCEIAKICISYVKFHQAFTELWAVVNQEPEFDLLIPKEDLDKSALSEYADTKGRFPLFAKVGA
jgi:hypothetical protein